MIKALLLLSLFQYTVPFHTGANATAPGGGAITLDSHCVTDNGSGAVASCTLATVQAGDTITVGGIGRSGTGIAVTDGNSQTYTPIYFTTDASNPSVSGISYTANAITGSTTVQVVISGGTSSYAVIFAQAWHNTNATTPLDSTFSSSFFTSSTGGTVANGNCGTARTPGNANSLVLVLGAFDSATPSVGTNYTVIDTDPSNSSYLMQYWIQTTATSTNGAFVSAADDWSVGCAAFHP
jgi:type IV secretory pathway VirB3-like protein